MECGVLSNRESTSKSRWNQQARLCGRSLLSFDALGRCDGLDLARFKRPPSFLKGPGIKLSFAKQSNPIQQHLVSRKDLIGPFDAFQQLDGLIEAAQFKERFSKQLCKSLVKHGNR